MTLLSDGRRMEAELLGADSTFDLSLLQLLEPGPYPHVTLDPTLTCRAGAWVLKLGHPMGYRRDRPPVVRLGRVLFQNQDIFVTDCLIAGGDSGGPFVDLDGHLLGLVNDNNVPAKLKDSLSNVGPGSVRYGPFSSTTNCFIQNHLAAMLRRELAPFDEKAAKRLDESCRRVDDNAILSRGHWTQGVETARAFQDVIRNAWHSVVTILDEADRPVALGTVVAAHGWIVTTAGTLPAEPRCRLLNGQVVAADVVGMNPASDLALLNVPGTNPPPIRWAEQPAPVAGTILAAAGMARTPLAIGIVSVPRRDLPGPFPTRIARRIAKRPRVFGKPTAEGFRVDMVYPTEAADIVPGDVILMIAGRTVRNDEDVCHCVVGRVEGERIPVKLLRGGKRLDLILTLVAEPALFAGFPTLFEHDMPLTPDQCGGPVVDLDGVAVGITLHRDQYGCMAIPGDCVQKLLTELKSGGLSDKWIKPPPALPNHHEPTRVDEKPRKATDYAIDE